MKEATTQDSYNCTLLDGSSDRYHNHQLQVLHVYMCDNHHASKPAPTTKNDNIQKHFRLLLEPLVYFFQIKRGCSICNQFGKYLVTTPLVTNRLLFFLFKGLINLFLLHVFLLLLKSRSKTQF